MELTYKKNKISRGDSLTAEAVGSAACQIAKINECRVVGSAGSKEKVKWLLEQ
jgi:NADPH-dependent curcumin reductase CurA